MELPVEIQNYPGNIVIIPFEIAKKLELKNGDWIELKHKNYVHYAIAKIENSVNNVIVNYVIAIFIGASSNDSSIF